MWHFTIRNRFGHSTKPRSLPTVPAAPRACKARLHLDALEDRTVPSGDLVGNLVIFGDSLTDTGNFLPRAPDVIPNAAALYYQGRMSDGPVWVDTLDT